MPLCGVTETTGKVACQCGVQFQGHGTLGPMGWPKGDTSGDFGHTVPSLAMVRLEDTLFAMKNMSLVAITLPCWVACTASSNEDSSEDVLPFCEKMEDADTFVIADGGDSTSSGVVEGRLITDESTDLHDPQWAGFLDYTIDNTDVGGTQQQGETQQDGSFIEVLGAGINFKISATVAGHNCANEVAFSVGRVGRLKSVLILTVCDEPRKW